MLVLSMLIQANCATRRQDDEDDAAGPFLRLQVKSNVKLHFEVRAHPKVVSFFPKTIDKV